jgi:small-conductance mechanosensitive channel
MRLPKLLAVLAALLPLGTAAAAGPDLSTPRRALRHFIDSARAGDHVASAAILDLRDVEAAERLEQGPRLARQLKSVLDARLWIDWDRVSDDPAGDPADGSGADVVGALPGDGVIVPFRLVRDAEGSWRIGRGVVAAIPSLYALHGPGWLGDRIPPVLTRLRIAEIDLWQWIGLVLAAILALAGAAIAGAAVRAVLVHAVRRTRLGWDERAVASSIGPARLLLGTAAFAALVRALHLAAPAQAAVSTGLRVLVVATFTWAGVRAIRLLADLAQDRLAARGGDPTASRGARTQVMVLRRVADVVVVAVGAAAVLLQFDGLRAVGTSLLASAGVAGIVIGLAAQRSIATLLAGIQLSITQPIRVGDVVIVEGEWGTIEEITLTYVVVKIWDLRRLVVPMTRFLDSPFQNWTRTGADLLGTVFIHADWRVPVEAVREEVRRFAATRPEWDGKVAGLQVTDAKEWTVELRALVSAPDASQAWDLRCALREHLVGFLQRLDDGRHLPRSRVEAPEVSPQPARNVARPFVPRDPA